MPITRDDEVLGGEPRIDGTRVGVRHVAGRVIEGGYTPAYVADQLDLSPAAVYEALSFWYANPDEMRSVERANPEAFENLRETALKPKTSSDARCPKISQRYRGMSRN